MSLSFMASRRRVVCPRCKKRARAEMVGLFRVWYCTNRACPLFREMIQKDDSRHADITVYRLTEDDLKRLSERRA